MSGAAASPLYKQAGGLLQPAPSHILAHVSCIAIRAGIPLNCMAMNGAVGRRKIGMAQAAQLQNDSWAIIYNIGEKVQESIRRCRTC
jgi:hypothetical protein